MSIDTSKVAVSNRDEAATPAKPRRGVGAVAWADDSKHLLH